MAAESSKRINRPVGRFRFLVTIDGLDLAQFKSVSGLGHEVEVLSQQEGGLNDRQHKLPAQGSYPNITFKQGYLLNDTLESWHREFSLNPAKAGRKTGSIVLLSDAAQPIARWDFREAWPVKWEGPELDASQGEAAIESIEIAHEGIQRKRI